MLIFGGSAGGLGHGERDLLKKEVGVRKGEIGGSDEDKQERKQKKALQIKETDARTHTKTQKKSANRIPPVR